MNKMGGVRRYSYTGILSRYEQNGRCTKIQLHRHFINITIWEIVHRLKYSGILLSFEQNRKLYEDILAHAIYQDMNKMGDCMKIQLHRLSLLYEQYRRLY